MMSFALSRTIENISLVVLFLMCMYGAYVNYKHYKTLPGADLVSVGLLCYGIYGLLAFTGSGFNGSYFRDWSLIGRLDSLSFLYFLSWALRLGLILVIIGLYRIGRSLKT